MAQEEAWVNNNTVDTEHILLGILRQTESDGAKALDSIGISLKTARSQVQEVIYHAARTPAEYTPFSPHMKRVFLLALKESNRCGNGCIRTDHILLGIIQEGQGVAARILAELGADQDRIRLWHGCEDDEPITESSSPTVTRQSTSGRADWATNESDLLGMIIAINERLDVIERRLGIKSPCNQ
jgi:ATP-dependent Clp protease ATP-binding subunit ClpC